VEAVGPVTAFPLTWPPAPTHDVAPPADHFYASALWLLGRHPSLVRLVERVPGAVATDEDGPWLALDELADALDTLDGYLLAWREYRASTYEPRDEDKWQAWEDAGPRTSNAGALAIAPMSRTEVSRLRLLAFFAPPSGTGRRLTVSDLGGFDHEGQRLLRDWTAALLRA
jgi:hypothetical protein